MPTVNLQLDRPDDVAARLSALSPETVNRYAVASLTRLAEVHGVSTIAPPGAENETDDDTDNATWRDDASDEEARIVNECIKDVENGERGIDFEDYLEQIHARRAAEDAVQHDKPVATTA